MGGKAGHMKHLYENPALTFREIKQIFSKINDGKMLVTEKIDGQNCLITYSVTEGKVKAARNNDHLAKGGISVDNVTLLSDVTELQKSLSEAMMAFEDSVKKLSIEEQIDIFGPNSNYYYNSEVQDPDNSNVFRYDSKKLCIHRTGHLLNNKYTNMITEDILSDQFSKLEESVNKQNVITENVTDKFIVTINPIRKLEPLQEKSCFENSMRNLQTEMQKYKMTDKSSLAEYILERLDEEITKQIPTLPTEAKVILIKRLMKVKEVTAKNVYKVLNELNRSDLIENVRTLLETEVKLHKNCISPVEEVVTDFGAGVLNEFVSLSVKDPVSESLRIKSKLKEIFDFARNSNNLPAQIFINNQLSRISKTNSLDNLKTTCEGIVFKFNNDVYKMTGHFSPLNQILGMSKYSRGTIKPLQMSMVTEQLAGKQTAVIVWGRFNPPTIGHEVVFKGASDIAKRENADFFIIPTKTVDKQKNPLTFEEKTTYINKIFPEYGNNILTDPNIKTIFQAAKEINNKGYKNIKVIVGADRKADFETLKDYNNKEFNFDSIEILSAGDRIDGEGTSSMSASKMREAAIVGNIKAFMAAIAGRLSIEEGYEMMNLIRSRLQVTGEDGKKKALTPVLPSSLGEDKSNKWQLLPKKQTDIKEMSGAGGGAVAGHVDTWLEGSDVNYTSMTSRYGSSSKRDDTSGKEKIKILFKKEEEQFMVDRKEFIEEIKLRKLVREGLKKKIKERQESVVLEENQLRLVIRKLLNEKQKDEPRHANTGINLLKDLLKTIVPSIEDDYKDLTTNSEQIKSFRAHLLNGVINIFKSAEGLQQTPEQADDLTEQEEVDPNRPTDPRFIPVKTPKAIKKEPVDNFTIQGLDKTGANVAKTTFRKIENKIKNTYDNLTDQKDREMFKDYLITNLKLHMDIFDNEMQGNMQEPSTPEYEQEKQKLDVNPAQTQDPAAPPPQEPLPGL
jgi:methyl-accepting chemotaxis protein